jgi:biopolymer transport protein ExbB
MADSSKGRRLFVHALIILAFVGVWAFFVVPWAMVFEKGRLFMWPLAACSILAWAVIIERARSLRAAEQVDTSRLRNRVADALRARDVDGAIEICRETPGPVASILVVGLRKFKLLTELGREPDAVEAEVVKSMEDHGVHVVADLERYLPVLSAVGNVAPLFGFAGTVSGMMAAFENIKRVGMEAQLLAGDISEALITTAAGLMIAIPAYIAFNYFTSRVQRLVLDIEQTASELMEVVSIQLLEPSRPPADGS